MSIQSYHRGALVHGAEGWTTLRPARIGVAAVQNGGAQAASSLECTIGSLCCKRHPRTASCRGGGGSAAAAAASSTIQVRDDLYVLDGVANTTVVPPAVVRAYEACDAADALESKLKQAQAESAAARSALQAKPLPIAAIIFFGTHLERLPLIRETYEPYFDTLIFMALSRDIVNKGRSRRKSMPNQHYHFCRDGLKATYACVASLTATHAAKPGIRGVLYLHFDLWLKPWELLPPLASAASSTASVPSLLDTPWALPPQRIMIKAPGPTRLLPLDCFNASRPHEYIGRFTTPNPGDPHQPIPSWTWSRDLPPARVGLWEACGPGGQRLSPTRCDPHRICVGWADLYYVPATLYTSFRRLSRIFGQNSANAELAVPTMMRILSDESRRPLHRLPCWGFCCSATPCPELLVRHTCGHRMRLEVDPLRTALERLWQRA